MRKHARNWLMQIILGIIILVFIFYFGSMGGGPEPEKVVTVDGIIISRDEFQKEYRQLLNFYRQRYGTNLSDEMLDMLNPRQRVYESLVNRAVILAKAEELNLDVSDEEVQQAIFSNPNFQRNGNFDLATYERVLFHQGLDPDDFEALQRRSLRISKLERLIKESVKVSDFEAYELYRMQNQALKVAFARIDPAGFERRLDPSSEELRKYLETNAESFRIPRKVKVRYLRFAASDYIDAIPVSEEMIENYYHGNIQEFEREDGDAGEDDYYLTLEEVRDRIARKLAGNRALDEAYREAKTAHDRIYQLENFDEYAAEHGLAPVETEFFSERNPPRELAAVDGLFQWAFELGIGEMSPVLSDEQAHYLVRVVDDQPSRIPELEEVRDMVERRWRADESFRLALEKGGEILVRLKEGEITIGALPAEEFLVTGETEFFIPGDDVPHVGYSEEILEALFQLSERNPLADQVFFVDGGFVILELLEKEPVSETDWEMQRDDITAALMRFKKDRLFQSWLLETREALMASGRMKIHFRPDNL